MGKLYIGDEVFHTLERPWISSPHHKGGKNFESCVPDGIYLLTPYSSEDHPEVWRLTNSDLDVFGNKPASNPGRWDILIHVGNYVADVVGCVAVGLTADEEHVWNSKKAIARLRTLLTEEHYELSIEPLGARNAGGG
jgi:hypothetical protein